MDAATKAGLLDLLAEALAAGWSLRRACHELELPERRVHRWIGRRAGGRLADRAPGGSPVHGLLEDEVAEILALFDQWGETDRSHRKLAHRGSYLHRVWVSPSSVRRVLFLADKHFRPLPRPGRSVRKPFPDWVTYTPGSIWIYDTTHFTAAGMAVLIIEDLVSRKWLTEVVSVEETSTQVELAFTAALAAEGLLDQVETRHQDGTVDLTVDDETRPILLAVSDNGPQMTSGSTREFMALCAIAQHFGRPGTPTDQAWIESLNGHLKAEYPHLLAIRDPATCAPNWRSPGRTTTGSASTPASGMSARTTNTKDEAKPSARPAKPDSSKPGFTGLPGTATTGKLHPPGTPTMLANRTRKCVINSDTRQRRRVDRPGRAGRRWLLREPGCPCHPAALAQGRQHPRLPRHRRVGSRLRQDGCRRHRRGLRGPHRGLNHWGSVRSVLSVRRCMPELMWLTIGLVHERGQHVGASTFTAQSSERSSTVSTRRGSRYRRPRL